MTRTELVYCGLSFLGALAGVYAGSHFEQANWETRFELEQKRIVLEKRVALVERVVVLLNKEPLMRGLQASLSAETELARLAAGCEALKLDKKTLSAVCKTNPKGDSKHVEEIGKDIYMLNADWAAAASLSAMYFGQRTRDAIRETKSIWVASDAQRQNIIEAMGAEINDFKK